MTSAHRSLGAAAAILCLASALAAARPADDPSVKGRGGCGHLVASADERAPLAARPVLALDDDGRHLAGRVREHDGRAAEDVEIALLHAGRVPPEVVARTRTDARGAFELRAPHHDDDWEGACVLLRAPDGPPLWATASRRGTDTDVVLPRRCRLYGRLRLDDGTPAAGARVTALLDAGACALQPEHEVAARGPDAVSDAQGAFELALPLGTALLRLHLAHPQHESVQHVVLDAAGAPWEAQLVRDATLVARTDRPLPPGWTLRLRRAEQPLDLDDRGARDGVRADDLDVRDGVRADDLDVRDGVRDGLSDAAGAGAGDGDALVFAHVLPGDGYRLVVDDGAGERALPAPDALEAGEQAIDVTLPPARAWAPGTSWVVPVALVDAAGAPVTPAGWRARFGVAPPPLRLEDADGRAGVAIETDEVWWMPGTWTPPVTVTLGAERREGLEPGEVARFAVDADAHAAATGTLALEGPASGTRLVVALRRDGRGRPITARNATRLPGLPPGTYTVHAAGDGLEPLRATIEIRAGEMTALALRPAAAPAR